ncbi:SusD/RagB family nutrient-binding outer membrane lipoprotein [Flavobacterium praedii]|uniref:SusD/RagB family nutrient-binding outer membrane lipoprotein n=1 Tax=Flavobacterium praedii TaxID=3002900 RepID=UPI002481B9EF|nr:SusD/RagB family nutrient-binding outer membrane lipoprotein [Flavobacterium praedii]
MKKILILIGILSITFGCTDDNLTSMNVDTKNPTAVPAGALLGNAEKNLIDQMVNTNVNSNVFRLFVQQWTETTYLDESRYDILQRNVPDNHWRTLYRDVLRDLKEASAIVSVEPLNADPSKAAIELKVKNNKLAIIELLNVYTYSVLVDTFGNIPYTQALQSDKFPSPTYDDAQTIYADLFIRLDAALLKLDSANKSFGDQDFIYQGNVAKWEKFANSLKLKMAITVADVAELNPKSKAEAAIAAGVFTASTDNATLQYLETSPNTNPLYEDLVISGRYDFVAADTFVDRLNTLNDPRRQYFYIDIEGVYIGCPYAEGGDFENFSSAGDPTGGPTTRLLEPTLEGILLDYTEVQFYLAEATERGYTTGGTAKSFYDNAVTSSIVYWGGTVSDATTYLTNDAPYTGGVNWKKEIGTQASIAFYNRGFEAWTSYRKLDFPVLDAPANAATAAEGVVPRRFTYPVNEQTLNKANYSTAATAIGGDKLKTKLFWDKN